MSKSLDNYVGIDEAPNEMFGKIMSISDELMWRWFDLLSFKTTDEIKELKADQTNGKNPRDIKIELAKELISRFHDEESADLAETNFINQFQKKNIPDDIEEILHKISGESIPLANLLKDCGMTSSTSEAMRMIQQGAVRIDEQKITDKTHQVFIGTSAVYQVGKENLKKLILSKKIIILQIFNNSKLLSKLVKLISFFILFGFLRRYIVGFFATGAFCFEKTCALLGPSKEVLCCDRTRGA